MTLSPTANKVPTARPDRLEVGSLNPLRHPPALRVGPLHHPSLTLFSIRDGERVCQQISKGAGISCALLRCTPTPPSPSHSAELTVHRRSERRRDDEPCPLHLHAISLVGPAICYECAERRRNER